MSPALTEVDQLEHPTLAVIEGSEIPATLLQEPMRRWWNARQQTGRSVTAQEIREQRAALAQRHVRELLVAREAETRDVTVDPGDDETRLAGFIASLQPTESLSEYLHRSGETRDEVLRRLRSEELLRTMVADVVSPITDADVSQWYDANRSLFVRPRQVLIERIRWQLNPEADREQRDQVRRHILEMLGELPFPSTANLQRRGWVSAAIEKGWYSPSELPDPVARWITSADDGDISELFATARGFELDRRVAERPAQTMALAEVRERIREQLREREIRRQRHELLSELHVRWTVSEPLAEAIADEKLRSRRRERASLRAAPRVDERNRP